jgi:hypothetical protein
MTVSVLNPITASKAEVPVKTKVVYMDRPIKTVAKEMFDEKSYQCFINLMMKESHLNPLAVNPTSGAQGIAQLLPSTMKSLGLAKTKNPNIQIVGFIAYASRRHASICGAWRYFQKNNHY